VLGHEHADTLKKYLFSSMTALTAIFSLVVVFPG
jgi:hypothetical protein